MVLRGKLLPSSQQWGLLVLLALIMFACMGAILVLWNRGLASKVSDTKLEKGI